MKILMIYLTLIQNAEKGSLLLNSQQCSLLFVLFPLRRVIANRHISVEHKKYRESGRDTMKAFISKAVIWSINPLSPSIKLQFLLLCFHAFLSEVVGRSF